MALCKKDRFRQSASASHNGWLVAVSAAILISHDFALSTLDTHMQPVQANNLQLIASADGYNLGL